MKIQSQTTGLILRNSWGIFMSRFVVIIAIMIVFFLFSHQLTIENNSDYLNFYVRFSMLSLIASAGMTIFLYSYSIETIKLFWEQTGIRQKSRYLAFVSGITCILLFLHFFNQIREINALYLISLTLYFWANLGIIITDTILTVGKMLTRLIYINLIYSTLYIGVHLLALQSGYSLEPIITGLSVLACLKLAINLFIVKRIFENTDPKDAPVIHPRRIKLFWVSVFTYDMIQVFFKFADKFLVSIIISAGITAVYINGTFEIPFISLVCASVGNASLLHLNRQKLVGKQTMTKAIDYSVRLMGTVTLMVFFFFFVFRTEFITFFFSEKYIDSAPIFGISLFKLLTYVFTISFILKFKKRGDILNISAVIDIVVTVLLLYPLFYFFSLEGIILSFVAGSLASSLYTIIKVAQLVKVNIFKAYPFKYLLFNILILGITAYSVKALVSRLENNLSELATGGFVIGFTGLIILYFEFYKNKFS